MDKTKQQIKKNILGAEAMFHAQMASARDYIINERQLGFFPERTGEVKPPPNEDTLNTMKKHPFVLWLHQQTGFSQAQDKIAKAQLAIINPKAIEIVKRYRECLALERLCALHIHFFTDNKNKLAQAVVTEKDRRPILAAMKKLRHVFNKGGGFYFANGAKQHLLQILLEDLCQSPVNNVYSAKREHGSLLRQVVTTNFAQALFRTYIDLTLEQAVNICLDITSVFFSDVMDRRDAERVIHEISDNVREENKFLKKTGIEILFEYGLSL